MGYGHQMGDMISGEQRDNYATSLKPGWLDAEDMVESYTMTI